MMEGCTTLLLWIYGTVKMQIIWTFRISASKDWQISPHELHRLNTVLCAIYRKKSELQNKYSCVQDYDTTPFYTVRHHPLNLNRGSSSFKNKIEQPRVTGISHLCSSHVRRINSEDSFVSSLMYTEETGFTVTNTLLHHYSQIKFIKKSKNSRILGFSHYFCLTMEGSKKTLL